MALLNLPETCLQLLIGITPTFALKQFGAIGKNSHQIAQPQLEKRRIFLPQQFLLRITRYLFSVDISHLCSTSRYHAMIIRQCTNRNYWTSGNFPVYFPLHRRMPTSELPKGFPPFLYHSKGYVRGPRDTMDEVQQGWPLWQQIHPEGYRNFNRVHIGGRCQASWIYESDGPMSPDAWTANHDYWCSWANEFARERRRAPLFVCTRTTPCTSVVSRVFN
jgi:hypothetical protein